MVFSTVLFLFRFLPITLALYYLAPARLKNTVLFLCSLVFLGRSTPVSGNGSRHSNQLYCRPWH